MLQRSELMSMRKQKPHATNCMDAIPLGLSASLRDGAVMRRDVVRLFRLAAFLHDEIAFNVSAAQMLRSAFPRFRAQFQSVEKVGQNRGCRAEWCSVYAYSTEVPGQVLRSW